MRDRLNILLLCDDSRAHADTVREHLAAFRRYSHHQIDYFNPMGLVDSAHLELDAYDVVVIHYSLVIIADGYISPSIREKIRRFPGLKVQFLQDEYRWVDSITEMMVYLEIDLLFSIVPEAEIAKVYGARLPETEILPTLAGYVPEKLVGYRSPPLASRPIDVGYRGRVLPYWNGALSQEKVWIAQGVLARIAGTGLRHDIAWGENDRIYGKRWNRFLASCRSTLGSESGTSITDFDGTVEAGVTSYLVDHPGATFDEVSRAVLSDVEGNVMMNVVSPRTFEAAAIGTPMILFPGFYGGTVEPWSHYVPLEKDFSNFDDVIEVIRDVPLLERLVANARADIVDSGTYSLRKFIGEFDAALAQRASVRGKPKPRLLRAKVARARSTGTISGFDPKARIRRGSQTLAAVHVALHDPQLRRLGLAYLTHRDLRRRIRASHVAADVLRLGILRLGQQGVEVGGQQFTVTTRIDADALVFLTHDRSTRPAEAVKELTLAEPRLVLWDHRSTSLLFHYRMPLVGTLSFSVGYYGVLGIHHFGTLPALSDALPQETHAVLASLRAPSRNDDSAPRTPSTNRATLPRRSFRRLRSPRASLGKFALAARLSLANRGARSAVLAWATDAPLRTDVRLRRLLEEIVKLHVLHEARSGRVAGVASIDAELSGDRSALRFATRTNTIDYKHAWPQLSEAGQPSTIVWDNSAVGEWLSYPTRIDPRLTIHLPGGRFEFDAFQRLVARHPEAGWAAIAGANSSRPSLLRRAVGSPLSSVGKGTLLVRALAKDPEVRRLFRNWQRTRADAAAPDRSTMLAELLRLYLLRSAVRGRLRSVPGVERHQEDDRVVFHSRPEQRPQAEPPTGGDSLIVWDHSAIGSEVEVRAVIGRLTVRIGEGGRHEFRLLRELERPHSG
jgi:hypothetical protein